MKTPILTVLLLIVAVVVGFFAFKQYKNQNPPSQTVNLAGTKVDQISVTGDSVAEVSQGLTLTITSPANQSTVNAAALQIIGTTSPNAEIFVNDTEAKADSTGNFIANVSLDEGENILTIVANDDQGNYAEKELTVFLQATE